MDNFKGLQRLDVIVIVCICAIAFFLGLGSRSLFSQDVVRYAEIAREMIHFDSWIIPRFNGEIYANKPAPYIWSIAATSRLIGEVNEWTARLPSAFAALGTVIFTYLLACRMYGRNVGIYSALSLVACYKFNLLARTSRTDMPFTFFVIGALYFLHSGIVLSSKRGKYYIIAFAMLAGSVLMKGPAGLVIIIAALIAYSIAKRDRSPLWNRLIIWGFLIFIFIVGLWVIPTCIIGGSEFARDLVFKQNVGRFAGEIDHAEPFYYYFYKLPLEIAPLNLLLPLILAFYLSGAPRQKRDMTLLVIYLVVSFVFFQISQSRNIRYLLPLYPGIAVLYGIFWDDLIRCKGALPKIANGFALITSAVIVISSIAVVFAMPVMMKVKNIPNVLFGLMLSVILAIALSRFTKIWRTNRGLAALICFTAVSVIAYVFLVVEMDFIEGLPEQAAFGKELRNAVKGDLLCLYKYRRPDLGHTMPSEFFYSGEYTPPVESKEELRGTQELNESRIIYILALQSVFDDDFRGDIGVEILLEKKYMDEEIVLARIQKE